MTRGRVGIDHLQIAVRDPEAARQGWTRLGFAVGPRGTEIGSGRVAEPIMLRHDLLELIGPAGVNREGAVKVAWVTEDAGLKPKLARLRHQDAADPYPVVRQYELPEGSVLVRRRLYDIPAEQSPALASVDCEHVPPRLPERAEWLSHPNGAVSLLGATVIVPETASLVEPYERLCGMSNVQATDDILTVRVGMHRIILATPEDFEALYPQAEPDPSARLPFIALVTIGVTDAEASADHLTDWQLPCETVGDGTILVPAEVANGLVLEFVTDRRWDFLKRG